MIEEVTRDAVSYNHPPHRFEAGTPPIVQAIGLAAALDYIEGIGRTASARMRKRCALTGTNCCRRLVPCA